MTETKRNLTALAEQIYQNNKEKGFWDEERNIGELFMLIISEAAEALEAHREGKFADLNTFLERVPPQTHTQDTDYAKSMFEAWFKNCIKDSFEDELSDVVIRVLDFVGSRGYDVAPIEAEEESSGNVGDMLCYLCELIIDAKKQVCYSASSLIDIEYSLYLVIDKCYSIAQKLNFDLDRHIELKLKYNSTRPYKHGKKY